jgi:CHASE3 domain sensor protein
VAVDVFRSTARPSSGRKQQMIERTKAVFVVGAGAVLLGVVAIWWYLKRLKS